METHTCVRCGQTKPISEFVRKSAGKRPYRGICKVCECERTRKWRRDPNKAELRRAAKQRQRERRKQWINEIKSALTCQVCGESEPVCLHFHHIDPSEKDFTVATIREPPANWEEVKREMTKCAVLCANCHAKLHAGLLADVQLVPITFDESERPL